MACVATGASWWPDCRSAAAAALGYRQADKIDRVIEGAANDERGRAEGKEVGVWFGASFCLS